MRDDLRRRLREGRLVFGAWTSIGHSSITEIMAGGALDFVGIDVEHGTISQEQFQGIIAAAQATGVACVPRVASHNRERICAMLAAARGAAV